MFANARPRGRSSQPPSSSFVTVLRTANGNRVPAVRSACQRVITRSECVSDGAKSVGNWKRRRKSGSSSPSHMTAASVATNNARVTTPSLRSFTLLAYLLLAEFLDVVADVCHRFDRPGPLHHHADLLDHLGVCQGGDIADGHPVRDGGQNAPHDFSRARLRHVGNDAHALRPRDFPDERLDLFY